MFKMNFRLDSLPALTVAFSAVLPAQVLAAVMFGLNSSHQIVKFDTSAPLASLPALVATDFFAEGAITFGPDGLLYGIDASSNVWSVNLHTAERRLVTSGFYAYGDIEFGPDGKLYGLSSSHLLQRYDPATGLTVPIATGFNAFGDIRFGPDGKVYGLSASQSIVRADPAYPLSGIEVLGGPFDSRGAFTFGPDGLIYGIDPQQNLYTLNSTTGIREFLAFGHWGTGDLQFGPDGFLYGLSASNYLQRLNVATGELTPVSLGFWGGGDISFEPQESVIPEPKGYALVLTALAILGFASHRKKQRE